MNCIEQYYQTLMKQYIEDKLGNSVWIQVSGHKTINEFDIGFWCGFVSKDCTQECLRDYSWSIDMQSGFCFTEIFMVSPLIMLKYHKSLYFLIIFGTKKNAIRILK